MNVNDNLQKVRFFDFKNMQKITFSIFSSRNDYYLLQNRRNHQRKKWGNGFIKKLSEDSKEYGKGYHMSS